MSICVYVYVCEQGLRVCVSVFWFCFLHVFWHCFFDLQGSLADYSLWGHKESDTAERLISCLITFKPIMYSDGIIFKCLGSINNCFFVAKVLKYPKVFCFSVFSKSICFLKPGGLWGYSLSLWLFFTVVPRIMCPLSWQPSISLRRPDKQWPHSLF